MNEIFGGYGWELSYPDRKWIADMCQVHGVNVLIPHAFDPKGDMSSPDGDYPPFYYYTGDEANWPNYKAWCERQNRLGYMLSGNDSDNRPLSGNGRPGTVEPDHQGGHIAGFYQSFIKRG